MNKVLLGVAGAVLAIGAAVVGGVVVAMPVGVSGPGAVLAELQGHTDTDSFADAGDAPDGWLPGWVSGSDVVVVRPGEAAGDDSGAIRADLVLDPGTELPADCTPADSISMPWDGGGSWPELTDQQRCGDWVAVQLGDHLYLWGETSAGV
ncbi:hypothetical protein [Modestobacter roseus]|uniref:Uncharacterized protein n=1 Tax=Modestobacter roseus TaxID=1181884 RepID=A0A562IUT3_9ACTN|nr:hypothetical protein [Modestobacter roseus]MQA33600.1 hypothetical protein [Modestobacter roseus]TWH74767.1 hypothetical protein JD78_03312 [Modestobacter roseus]